MQAPGSHHRKSSSSTKNSITWMVLIAGAVCTLSDTLNTMLAPRSPSASHPCSALAPLGPVPVMITTSGRERAQPESTRHRPTGADTDQSALSELVGAPQCERLVLINESLLHGHDNDIIISRSREVRSRQPWTLIGCLASALTNSPGRSWSLLPVQPVEAIRLLRLDAPDSIQVGQPMRLRCLYETRGDRLDSLSWSKNGKEFYRYQPGERRKPVIVFEMPGISPDRSKSRNNTVVLTNTTLDTTGRYKCEVTGSTLQVVNMEKFVQVERAASSAPSLTPICAWMFALVLVVSRMLLPPARHTRRT